MIGFFTNIIEIKVENKYFSDIVIEKYLLKCLNVTRNYSTVEFRSQRIVKMNISFET